MGVLITTMALVHHLNPIRSTKTCGLDDGFPPDDLGSGRYSPFIIYIPYITAAL